MSAVFERELKSYFNGLLAWIVAAGMLLFSGIFVFYYNLSYTMPNFEYVMGNMVMVYIVMVPLLSMRVIAEERKQKTDQLLYALPMKMSQIVLGKYFAQLVVLAIPVGVMALIPLLLSFFGTINFALAYTALVGFFFLGAALLALGMFISSLTENQAIAAGISFLAVLLNYFLSSLTSMIPTTSNATVTALIALVILIAAVLYVLTKNGVFAAGFGVVGAAALFLVRRFAPDVFENLFSNVIDKLSLFGQFYTFVDGVLDLTVFVYFAAIAFLFLFLSVQSLEKRRWS